MTTVQRKNLARLLIKQLGSRIVRPSAKAFFFAYLYVVLPRVVNYVAASVSKKRPLTEIAGRISRIITRALHLQKFPMLAGNLVLGINVLEPLIYKFLRNYYHLGKNSNLFLSTFAASFLSALVAFPAFQNHIIGYGRFYSLDLTLLVATRAMDTALSSTLAKIAPPALAAYGDSGLFIVSCTFIMFAWFFNPHALPPAYRNWITSAANMDNEIVHALKALRDKTLVYGEECPDQDILVDFCKRYGQDPKRGSAILNQPFDCEVVHAFQTSNCEVHALWRFWRGFVFAIKIYGPLNAFMLLFPSKLKMATRLVRAAKSSLRSSCFLGTFIGLYWYAVCLARKRLFPKLFPNVPKTRWDETIAPTAGAFACGWSSFVESAQRRKELALFVAPRALGTLVSAEPTPKNLKIESLVFSLSMAVLVAYSKNDALKVRGIFGKGLKQVFNLLG